MFALSTIASQQNVWDKYNNNLCVCLGPCTRHCRHSTSMQHWNLFLLPTCNTWCSKFLHGNLISVSISTEPEELLSHSIAQMVGVNVQALLYEIGVIIGNMTRCWYAVCSFACKTIIKSYVNANHFDINIITIFWTVQRSKAIKTKETCERYIYTIHYGCDLIYTPFHN